MLCAVKLRVLGLMAYWYIMGSAFHQIPQSSYIFRRMAKFLIAAIQVNLMPISIEAWRRQHKFT